jgi:hypothetical protein
VGTARVRASHQLRRFPVLYIGGAGWGGVLCPKEREKVALNPISFFLPIQHGRPCSGLEPGYTQRSGRGPGGSRGRERGQQPWAVIKGAGGESTLFPVPPPNLSNKYHVD